MSSLLWFPPYIASPKSDICGNMESQTKRSYLNAELISENGSLGNLKYNLCIEV
uniref:Uncharacterized protein n=1 Tax=Arundo donax TaxID=35708 RepID=A0A0A9EFA4_ARUDO